MTVAGTKGCSAADVTDMVIRCSAWLGSVLFYNDASAITNPIRIKNPTKIKAVFLMKVCPHFGHDVAITPISFPHLHFILTIPIKLKFEIN